LADDAFIHFVNAFQKKLEQLIEAPPFDGSQKLLAQQAGCDRALVSRILAGDRAPTPEFVGRLCGALTADQAAELLQAYLTGVVATVASTTRKSKASGKWTPSLRHVDVTIECQGRRKSA
jgi:transcriptional regulator with XRE-family HTH domain